MKMNLSSETYQNKATTNPEYEKKNKRLNNLSMMDISYLFQQDRNKQQVYTEWNAKIGEEEIYGEQRYINNSTQYFLVKNVLSNYVNDGNNNYFEAFSEEQTTVDNINYLYDFIGDSLKKNVTKGQLKAYNEVTTLHNERVKVGKISYRITDKEYKRLLKAILKDIKADKRAKEILSVGQYRVEDLKVNAKKHYINPKEVFQINLYVSKPLLKLVKYDFVYLKESQEFIYSIEGDMNKGVFYFSENGNIKYTAEYQSTKRRTSIIIFDRNENQIGTIKGEKDDQNTMITATIELKKQKFDLTYSAKYKDQKKTSYVREDHLTFKWIKNKAIQLQGDIEAESNVSADPKITVDTESSVLRASLTEAEEERLKGLKETIKERLEK